ncbi:MAG: permease [Elusimicrobia bacterium CG06_land_8_20_14_3_00_38_11]|nr:MAG: permease [Elusimicrobia bacterium CG06_land_8_20_14_3_00_38_11]
MLNIAYLIVGLAAGIMGGLFGLGGGTILIPALVYLFKMTQHQAQGTSLAAMIPPIGLLAAIKYYQAGHINIKVAAFVALGFFIGGYFGGTFAQSVSDPLLKKIFGVFIVIVGLNMFFGK